METLHWADYLIFASFLLASLAIGIYHACTGNKQRTTQEFIMANRELKVLPTMLSLLVSFQSALMILGFSAEIYMYGTQQWFGILLAYPLAILMAERLLVPWIYPMKLTSVYEYLERRYQSRFLRGFGCCLGFLTALLYIGPAMFAPSLALEAATGFPTMVSIPVMAIVATTYTAMGGMRAVIWTDVFQAGIMFAGMLAVLIKGSMAVGSLASAFEYVSQGDRITSYDFSMDPRVRHSFWSLVLGWGSTWGFLYGLQQASMQRYSATVSLRAARMSLLLNIPTLLFLVCLSFTVGVTVFAYFYKLGCDPLINGDISSPNQILPYFVKEIFKSVLGFSGLFLATLYSGALSSVSSSLSGCAANLWEDILKQKFPKISEIKAAIINKCIVVLSGMLGAGVAFLAAAVPGPVSQVSVAFNGATSGPLCGMFILGGVTKRAHWKGAFIGCITGLLINFWIGIGANTLPASSPVLPSIPSDSCSTLNNTFVVITNLTITTNHSLSNELHGLQNLYAISYLWYTPLGFTICLVIGWIASLILPSENTEVSDDLMIPWRAFCSFSTVPGQPSTEKMLDETNDTLEYYEFEDSSKSKLAKGSEGENMLMYSPKDKMADVST